MPSVAFDGNDFVVVWQDPRANAKAPLIYGARVVPDGTVRDSTGIQISSGASGDLAPAIACSTSDCLVTWLSGSGSGAAVRGARVSSDGKVVDSNGTTIAAAPLPQLADYFFSSGPFFNSGPAVTWTGSNYLVAWPQAGPQPPIAADVYAAYFVNDDGGLPEGGGFPVSADSTQQSRPAVASNGTGENLVVYQKMDMTPAFGAFRARGRFVGAGVWADAGVLLDASGTAEGGSPADSGDKIESGNDSGLDGGQSADAEPSDTGGGGPLDGSENDGAGESDSAVAMDSGAKVDSGSSGVIDGGASDAGMGAGAGASGGGCSCRASGGPSHHAWGWALALGILARLRTLRTRATRHRAQQGE